jgi:hypothetical protein
MYLTTGICALGSFGLCHKQLLSPSVLSRIASIVARYRNVIELCRTGGSYCICLLYMLIVWVMCDIDI